MREKITINDLGIISVNGKKNLLSSASLTVILALL